MDYRASHVPRSIKSSSRCGADRAKAGSPPSAKRSSIGSVRHNIRASGPCQMVSGVTGSMTTLGSWSITGVLKPIPFRTTFPRPGIFSQRCSVQGAPAGSVCEWKTSGAIPSAARAALSRDMRTSACLRSVVFSNTCTVEVYARRSFFTPCRMSLHLRRYRQLRLHSPAPSNNDCSLHFRAICQLAGGIEP